MHFVTKHDHVTQTEPEVSCSTTNTTFDATFDATLRLSRDISATGCQVLECALSHCEYGLASFA
jgi:hypothetical protein